MKKFVFSTIVLSLFYLLASAQSTPYNVVFDVTSKDTLVHQMVIRWIKEITSAHPNANIEVVYYGKGFEMVTSGKSVVSADVEKFAAMKNIHFNVCEMSLVNNNIEKSQLLPGIGTVPDGIYEIISRQHDGWGYIKAAR